MRRPAWLLVPILLAGGCSPSDNEAVLLPRSPGSAPDTVSRTHLGILHDGKTVKVGDLPDVVDLTFSRPPGASSFKELPPGFQDPYKARGWESAAQGFGSLYYNNVLVLAMHTEKGMPLGDVDAVLNSYIDNFGQPKNKLIGARTRYFFWESAPHRLMLYVEGNAQKDRFSLMSAIGDVVTMEALRMTPADALTDRAPLETNAHSPAN